MVDGRLACSGGQLVVYCLETHHPVRGVRGGQWLLMLIVGLWLRRFFELHLSLWRILLIGSCNNAVFLLVACVFLLNMRLVNLRFDLLTSFPPVNWMDGICFDFLSLIQTKRSFIDVAWLSYFKTSIGIIFHWQWSFYNCSVSSSWLSPLESMDFL